MAAKPPGAMRPADQSQLGGNLLENSQLGLLGSVQRVNSLDVDLEPPLLQRYVDKAVDTPNDSREKRMGRPRLSFKWSNGRLELHVQRLNELNPSQRGELCKVLQGILAKLQDAAPAPLSGA